MIRPKPVGPKILYSTNTFLIWYVNKHFRGDRHYVWCGPHFDPFQLGVEGRGFLTPGTSSPAEIYRDLYLATKRGRFDTHNAKIVSQKSGLLSRATRWVEAGEIQQSHFDDLAYMLKDNNPNLWAPCLYLIPTANIDPARIRLVPIEERAGYAEEFIIEDLEGHEFDRIQFNVD
jgi:hypothetical protein